MAKYVLKENKILREYESTKDIAKIFRDIVKEKYGLTSRDVSITAKNIHAVNVSIKSMKGIHYKKQLEVMGKSKEKIDRDERSGEILSGGNTFVFVKIDWNFRKELWNVVDKEVKKLPKDFLELNNTEKSNRVTIFDYIDIMKVDFRGKPEGYSVINSTSTTLRTNPSDKIENIYGSIIDEILEHKKSEQILRKYFK